MFYYLWQISEMAVGNFLILFNLGKKASVVNGDGSTLGYIHILILELRQIREFLFYEDGASVYLATAQISGEGQNFAAQAADEVVLGIDEHSAFQMMHDVVLIRF